MLTNHYANEWEKFFECCCYLLVSFHIHWYTRVFFPPLFILLLCECVTKHRPNGKHATFCAKWIFTQWNVYQWQKLTPEHITKNLKAWTCNDSICLCISKLTISHSNKTLQTEWNHRDDGPSTKYFRWWCFHVDLANVVLSSSNWRIAKWFSTLSLFHSLTPGQQSLCHTI